MRTQLLAVTYQRAPNAQYVCVHILIQPVPIASNGLVGVQLSIPCCMN